MYEELFVIVKTPCASPKVLAWAQQVGSWELQRLDRDMSDFTHMDLRVISTPCWLKTKGPRRS
jgi:hypothetical protein